MALLQRGNLEREFQMGKQAQAVDWASAFPPSHPRGIPKPPEVGGGVGWKRAGKGESTLLPPAKLGGRSGWSLEQGRGGTQEASTAPLQLCVQPAPPPRMSLLFCLETAADRRLRTATSRSEIPPPLRTRKPITHTVYSPTGTITVNRTPIICAQSCCAHTQPHLTIIQRYSGSDTKPRQPNHRLPIPLFQHTLSSSLHP